MLFVFSKEKIMCYLVTFSTVAILIGIAIVGMPRKCNTNGDKA